MSQRDNRAGLIGLKKALGQPAVAKVPLANAEELILGDPVENPPGGDPEQSPAEGRIEAIQSADVESTGDRPALLDSITPTPQTIALPQKRGRTKDRKQDSIQATSAPIQHESTTGSNPSMLSDIHRHILLKRKKKHYTTIFTLRLPIDTHARLRRVADYYQVDMTGILLSMVEADLPKLEQGIDVENQ